MRRKSRYSSNHKVKSEISNEKGAWSKEALDFSSIVESGISKAMRKYEGKLSCDAMMFIVCQAAFNDCLVAKSFSAKF